MSCCALPCPCQEAKENAHALQARTINLEKYGQDLKLKLHRVIEKTENDDKLIEMYKQELANSKKCMTPPPRPKSRTPPSLMDAEVFWMGRATGVLYVSTYSLWAMRWCFFPAKDAP